MICYYGDEDDDFIILTPRNFESNIQDTTTIYIPTRICRVSHFLVAILEQRRRSVAGGLLNELICGDIRKLVFHHNIPSNLIIVKSESAQRSLAYTNSFHSAITPIVKA